MNDGTANIVTADDQQFSVDNLSKCRLHHLV